MQSAIYQSFLKPWGPHSRLIARYILDVFIGSFTGAQRERRATRELELVRSGQDLEGMKGVGKLLIDPAVSLDEGLETAVRGERAGHGLRNELATRKDQRVDVRVPRGDDEGGEAAEAGSELGERELIAAGFGEA
jgi:hypothetical protein